MRRGLSVELFAFGAAFVVLIGLVIAILASMNYNPPVPPAKQNAACVTQGINLDGHDRPAENARDASRYIQVSFHNKVLKCSINGNLSSVFGSCLIGKEDNVLIEVNEDACNMLDVSVNETG